MKNYKKQKYSGNENGWHDPIVTLGVHSMQDRHAELLNDQFRSTGVKYEETTDIPSEFGGDATESHLHNEPNLEIKEGNVVVKDQNVQKEGEVKEPEKKKAKAK